MDRDSDLGHVVAAALGAQITTSQRLGGGDFAASYRLDLSDGSRVFAKTHADPPPHFFSTEATGLRWLRAAASLPVPAVLLSSDDPPLLVLEWIDEAPGRRSDEAAFGRGLADLHQAGAPSFGREDRRTTGSRGLPNEPCDTWAEFYATQRLIPLINLAADADLYDASQLHVFERVAGRLVDLGGPPEQAARLHGDLWAGNRVVDGHGASWLIDPACHGGHREVDLAMMRLFGGFGDAAFDAYNESFPLAPEWHQRVPLHQLAPLLVHAIKFGGGYVAAAYDAALRYA